MYLFISLWFISLFRYIVISLVMCPIVISCHSYLFMFGVSVLLS